ncbi:hypothetical protein [Azotobacter beijerinckii]|uniref:Uncharacterized protein n=1 Tax=Azotobacter beijerinckii TaxID=170623 RepID=A0A1I4ESD7_9GAMM|nr:hypothetical protein SAMN04244571_03365 [Azotobacter beijerinckii]SFL08632.1 hypothetical protein SAMN04244574_03047 [Azotobacter beijerinckii]
MPLRLEAGIQFLLPAQLIAQLLHLGLQGPELSLGGLLQPFQRGLVVMVQIADMQALPLDQVGSLLALLVIPVLAGQDPGSSDRPLPPRHAQTRRRPAGRRCLVLFAEQAKMIALGRIAQRQQILRLGIPQVHLMPRHRALATADQANRSATEIHPRATPLGQLPQGNIPAGIGRAVLIEIHVKENCGPHLSPGGNQQIGETHLLIGQIRQADDAIEYGLELRKEHFPAHAALIEEHHGLNHFLFFLHGLGLLSCFS